MHTVRENETSQVKVRNCASSKHGSLWSRLAFRFTQTDNQTHFSIQRGDRNRQAVNEQSFHQGVFKTLAPRGQDPNDWRTPTETRIDEWWHVRWTVVGKECICWVSTNQYKTSIQWWSENTSYLVWCDFFLLKNVSNLRNKQGQKYGTNQMDSVEPYTVLKVPLANQNF